MRIHQLLRLLAILLVTLVLAGPACAQGCDDCAELKAGLGRGRATPLAELTALQVATATPAPSTAEVCAQNTPCEQADHKVVIYLFWGDGCPHCAAEKPFLAELARRYPNVEVRAYEVWYNEANRKLFIQMAAAFGFEPTAVPTTFIGNQYWIGFAEPLAQQMEAAVVQCLASGCPDAGQGIVPESMPAPVQAASATPAQIGALEPNSTQTPAPMATATPAQVSALQPDNSALAPAANPNVPAQEVVNLPLFGAVDLAAQSLAISTALIAFVDGFNPCSLWVLSVLLALSLHTGSRKKVFVIGLVFLTVTSLVYVLFIAGLFTVFTFISFLGWVQVVVAAVALFFAGVNIKDYFWYKEGISFTIADEQKPGIYQRMRRVLNVGESWWGLIGATVALGAGVSIVEFSCTAGFPVLWTNLLAAHKVAWLTFGLLLVLYMFIYQLDELGIFLTAVFTFKASKLEEKHGRVLKLIGGTLMLTLAAVMLINPALMNRLSTSLLIFAIAFAAALLVLLVHRVILPRYGVYIGSEFAGRAAHRRAGSQRVRR